jgi:hypothetical protein
LEITYENMNLGEIDQLNQGTLHNEYISFVKESLQFITDFIIKLEQLKEVNVMSFVTSVDELIKNANNFKASK